MTKKSLQFRAVIRKIKSRNFRLVINYLIIVSSLFLALFLNWEIINALMLAIFIWLILFPKPGKTVVGFGFGLLFLTLLLLAIGDKDNGEKFASFAFVVFSFGVLSCFFQVVEKNGK